MCKEGSGSVVFLSLKPVMGKNCSPVSNALWYYNILIGRANGKYHTNPREFLKPRQE